MRFGMILLTIIGILCIVATVGDREGIYSSWYFILVFAMLGLNLTLCSVLRVFRVEGQKQGLMLRAAKADAVVTVPDRERWLRAHRFRQNGEVWMKHTLGFYGSFLTHASMLLLMASAACLFAFAERADYNICVGDSAELADGTVLTVEDFSLEDESGNVEYTSLLSAQLPDDTAVQGMTQVNHPVRIGRYTVYQQNYAYAAVIGVRTGEEEAEELVKLDEPAFLSLDGRNGIYFTQLFGNVMEENGEIRVSHGTEIINPAYEVTVYEDGREQTGLIYPGTTITAGGVWFTFHDPEAFPGLRVKTQPEWALWLLYLSFVLMTVGLFLCFFWIPEAAVVREDGITIVGQKDISMQLAQYREEG